MEVMVHNVCSIYYYNRYDHVCTEVRQYQFLLNVAVLLIHVLLFKNSRHVQTKLIAHIKGGNNLPMYIICQHKKWVFQIKTLVPGADGMPLKDFLNLESVVNGPHCCLNHRSSLEQVVFLVRRSMRQPCKRRGCCCFSLEDEKRVLFSAFPRCLLLWYFSCTFPVSLATEALF